jgi:Na+/H+ antiporter NhaC
VAIPIVVPLAKALNANIWLSMGAVISSGVVGSQCCFYSDASILTASSTECDPVKMQLAALPHNIIATIISTILFLIAGKLSI